MQTSKGGEEVVVSLGRDLAEKAARLVDHEAGCGIETHGPCTCGTEVIHRALGAALDAGSQEAALKQPRCKKCGHVGDRRFVLANDREWRDALGGQSGLTLRQLQCGQCSGRDFELVSPASSTSSEPQPIPRDFWREVPCGHPSDPVAMYNAEGLSVCHCGEILDVADALPVKPPEAPGPVVSCQRCGCYPAIPPQSPTPSVALEEKAKHLGIIDPAPGEGVTQADLDRGRELDEEHGWSEGERPENSLRVIWREPDGERRRVHSFIPIPHDAAEDFKAALKATYPKLTVYTYDEAEKMVASKLARLGGLGYQQVKSEDLPSLAPEATEPSPPGEGETRCGGSGEIWLTNSVRCCEHRHPCPGCPDCSPSRDTGGDEDWRLNGEQQALKRAREAEAGRDSRLTKESVVAWLNSKKIYSAIYDASPGSWVADPVTKALVAAFEEAFEDDTEAPALLTQEQCREKLLDDELIEKVARIPWDNDQPGAWDDKDAWEFEDGVDPREQEKRDLKSAFEAALDAAFGEEGPDAR